MLTTGANSGVGQNMFDAFFNQVSAGGPGSGPLDRLLLQMVGVLSLFVTSVLGQAGFASSSGGNTMVMGSSGNSGGTSGTTFPDFSGVLAGTLAQLQQILSFRSASGEGNLGSLLNFITGDTRFVAGGIGGNTGFPIPALADVLPGTPDQLNQILGFQASSESNLNTLLGFVDTNTLPGSTAPIPNFPNNVNSATNAVKTIKAIMGDNRSILNSDSYFKRRDIRNGRFPV